MGSPLDTGRTLGMTDHQYRELQEDLHAIRAMETLREPGMLQRLEWHDLTELQKAVNLAVTEFYGGDHA